MSRLTIALQNSGLDFDQATLVSEIRKSATGGEFDKKGRKHSQSDSVTVADTVGAIEDLLLAVDGAFYARFRPSSPGRLWRWIPLLGTLLLVHE